MRVVNTYVPGVPDLSHSGVSLMYVLTAGQVNDFKCYCGIVRLPPSDDKNYDISRAYVALAIADRGSPVNYDTAVTCFPFIKREEYRA